MEYQLYHSEITEMGLLWLPVGRVNRNNVLEMGRICCKQYKGACCLRDCSGKLNFYALVFVSVGRDLENVEKIENNNDCYIKYSNLISKKRKLLCYIF